MWQPHQIVQLPVLFIKSADNQALLALCSFCAPILLMQEWKVKDCRFKRDSEIALCLKQASMKEIIQHKLFKRAIWKLNYTRFSSTPAWLCHLNESRTANLQPCLVFATHGTCTALTQLQRKYIYRSRWENIQELPLFWGKSPWKTECRPVTAS